MKRARALSWMVAINLACGQKHTADVLLCEVLALLSERAIDPATSYEPN